MKAIRTALYGKLTGDATLTALLASATSVYHGVAPDQAAYPLVIFNRVTGTPEYTFAELGWDEQVWLIKGVDRNTTATKVDDIAARIDTLLTDQTLTITGKTWMSTRRESDVEYPEIDNGVQYRHAGARYRIRFQ